MQSQELADKLDELSTTISQLLNNLHSVGSNNSSEFAEVVNHAHALSQNASDLYKEISEQFIKSTRYTSEPIKVNGATVEIKQGSPRKAWKHDELLDVVSHRIYQKSVDLDTGEITKSPTDMMADLLKYAAVGYWRVSALADLNVDANDYCEVGESKKSVIIRRDK